MVYQCKKRSSQSAYADVNLTSLSSMNHIKHNQKACPISPLYGVLSHCPSSANYKAWVSLCICIWYILYTNMMWLSDSWFSKICGVFSKSTKIYQNNFENSMCFWTVSYIFGFSISPCCYDSLYNISIVSFLSVNFSY